MCVCVFIVIQYNQTVNGNVMIITLHLNVHF